MIRNQEEHLPGIVNGLAGLLVLLLSYAVEMRMALGNDIARVAGILVIVGGMGLVLWALFHIKGAFVGEVAPRFDYLVTSGPYRYLRHPVYLGITIAMFGVAIALRSWPGLAATLVIFLPAEIYRAQHEERALAARFGSEWEAYAARTGFLLPFVGRGEGGT
jgi:protein-S-isoprenylcysteine O-methyltransferase Ste14